MLTGHRLKYRLKTFSAKLNDAFHEDHSDEFLLFLQQMSRTRYQDHFF